MKRPLQRKIRNMVRVAGAITAAMALVVLASAKKKENVLLPDYVLKAQTVVVLILPDTGEPMNDPFANRKAQEEVEKAIMKWGRFRLAQEAFTADLVIGIRKGTSIRDSEMGGRRVFSMFLGVGTGCTCTQVCRE